MPRTVTRSPPDRHDATENDVEVLICVVNVSEGRDQALLGALDEVCAGALLDRHSDPDHHRSVFTLVGTDAPRALTRAAVACLDLRGHDGGHPRLGVVDVVPFVPLPGEPIAAALAERDRFAEWVATALEVPAFLYGPDRSLPEVRRRAWRDLEPDVGPHHPHPTAGAVCVGAREALIAYNLWLAVPDVALARSVAASVRSEAVRALGLTVGERVQVSLNLVAPDLVGPAEAYDLVAAHAPVAGAELVGLLPEGVLHRIPPERWPLLDLAEERTLERRLAALRRERGSG
jgi:glutamate formiminotransferase